MNDSQEVPLIKDMTVEIQGMKTKVEFNGRRGSIVSFDNPSRVQVRLSEKLILINRKNLVAVGRTYFPL